MRNLTMAAAPKAGATIAVLVIHTAPLACERKAAPASSPARRRDERMGAAGSGDGEASASLGGSNIGEEIHRRRCISSAFD
jgi:hypothetical protein